MIDATASGIPEPHDAQKQILQLPGRFKVAVCGRRFGKTVAAAIAAVKLCQSRAEQRVWWISPVQDQSDRVEREVSAWLRSQIQSGRRKKKSKDDDDDEDESLNGPLWQQKLSEHALICSNGSRIEFHSAHTSDHLRGAGLDLVILDEAADIPEQIWKSVLKPMLLERQGQAFIIGTPRGKNHWLHQVYLLGQNDAQNAARGAYSSIQFPTRANPRVPLEDLEEFRADMTPEMFRQEFEAEFIDGVNTIFPGVDECVKGEILQHGRPGARYITGIDLGQAIDFTAVCSISVAEQRLEGFARFNQMDWSLQEQMILDHLKRFPGPALVDSTGIGRRIFELLRDQHHGRVEPFHFSAQRRSEMLVGLQLGISERELKLARVPDLLGEMYAFTYLKPPGSAFGSCGPRGKMGAPGGLHDDCVMALAMAWYGLKKLGLWAASDANPYVNRGVFA